MNNSSWIEKLRQRWQLGSIFQVVIVLVVFACTGITIALIKRPLLLFLFGESAAGSTLVTVLYYIFILPLYNVVLLAYGFLFGQFDFFWKFEKRFLGRIFSGFRKTNK
ncbi:hypothetical protein KK062_07825 [Fulvivirgaceae bacterium PWU5]|jgi:hypothetical protein|uniref:DUF6787 domain-containing protein n=1 Tax=Dawidia cretensis TaxID=2782350 RepID=A0AAP2DVN4_9BACT|nr:DUF6787 family protein [Dawidia cretensis]MBT1708126.1 hypothetical protein [Dawidia cretensis]